MTDTSSCSSGATQGAPIEVDARGLRCPMPLLRAKQAMRDLDRGQRLLVLATDAGSERDFYAFADLAGHRIVEFKTKDGVYSYLLEVGGAGSGAND